MKAPFSSLIYGLCMIAACFLDSAYVLVVHGDSYAEPKSASRRVGPAPASDNSNRCIDWELIKVLSEMDIRNPSLEHETFVQKYYTTKGEKVYGAGLCPTRSSDGG